MCALRKLLKKEVGMVGKRGLMEGKMYFGEGPGTEAAIVLEYLEDVFESEIL